MKDPNPAALERVAARALESPAALTGPYRAAVEAAEAEIANAERAARLLDELDAASHVEEEPSSQLCVFTQQAVCVRDRLRTSLGRR